MTTMPCSSSSSWNASQASIGTPHAFLPRNSGGRPPRTETPASRKRRAAAATYADKNKNKNNSSNRNNTVSSGQDSLASSSVAGSEQSSTGQLLQPAQSFFFGAGAGGGSGSRGGMMANLFGGAGGAGSFDDIQCVDDDDDDDDMEEEESCSEFECRESKLMSRRRESLVEEGLDYKQQPQRQKKSGLFSSFRLGKKRNRSSKSQDNTHDNSNNPSMFSRSEPSLYSHRHNNSNINTNPPFRRSAPPLQQQQQQQQLTAPTTSLQRHSSLSLLPLQSLQKQQQQRIEKPPLFSVPSGSPTEISCSTNQLSHRERSSHLSEQTNNTYRMYNQPMKSATTLPRMGSFNLDIDTISADNNDIENNKIAVISDDDDTADLPVESIDGIECEEEDDYITPRRESSWKTLSTSASVAASGFVNGPTTTDSNRTEMVTAFSIHEEAEEEEEADRIQSVEIVDHASCTGGSANSYLYGEAYYQHKNDALALSTTGSLMRRQASWDRRLGRSDVYNRNYLPSRNELEELQELEAYLGIFSTTTKHRFAALWKHLAPSIEDAVVAATMQQRQSRNNNESLQLLRSQGSTSSMSTLSSTTNHLQIRNNNTPGHSIVLKRGLIQFEQYQDFQSELILLTRGFVVARPNYQYIPRFQAGDLWTSVVQVQPTNPLSITLSCTSRATTSSHLTLTQLKQQQQYGCYTYEISCETPQEQASWLDALRKVVIQAHDSAATNEKEMGGLGWQYRVVYVPFFTEAVTGNPIQKEKILAGSSGHIDLDVLDSYNSYAPLHYATRANHVRVMQFLLEAGADHQVGDGYGRTPMYYAELHQLPESTIQLLEAYGAKRSKKSGVKGFSPRRILVPGNCRTKLFVVVMVLLLVTCGTLALLWNFGMLEAIGIGGDSAGQDPAGLSLSASSTTSPTATPIEGEEVTSQPSVTPIPPILSRGNSTVESPTNAPSEYRKTPPPTTIAAVNTASPTSGLSTLSPTIAAYTSDLYRLLESASFDAGEALRQDGSPQQRALLWLLDNVNLNSYTNSKKIQRYALAVFYYSTNGHQWSNNLWWLSQEDECMWFNKQVATGYPTCEISTSFERTKTFTSLDLSFNNVQGTIPPEIGLLSGLRRLDLDGGPSGFLTGTLPSQLGELYLMEAFSARGNQLEGTLPIEIGNWELVRGIELSFNRLTGGLPGSISSMVWLTELNLEMNDLSGPLPSAELGTLTNLFKLSLGGNSFSGVIPSELGLLTKLRYLYLELNQFTSLPTTIGNLVNLNVLSLFENKLQGPIPSEVGNLAKLESLLLRSNVLYGRIPTEIGLMASLQRTLDLSFNMLSGPVPSELGAMTLLRSLYLQANKLSGPVPNEISQLVQLNTIRVEANDLTGVMPADICQVYASTFPNFYADCDAEITCECCTYCCSDGGNCSCQYVGTEFAFLC